MSSITIAGIGEVLWDVLPELEVLGGAPVNFAYQVNALGATGVPITTVGMDERGKKVYKALSEKGVDTSAISTTPHFPTGFVRVQLSEQGSATYSFPDDVAWDHLEINYAAKQLQPRLDGICFGTLAQRSKRTHHVILDYLDGLASSTLKIYDVNLRQHFYTIEIIEKSLQRADILKLNDEELVLMSELFCHQNGEASFLHYLIKQYDLAMAVLTRGAAGSILVTPDSKSTLQGSNIVVADTIGAGDAFTAALVIGYLQGLSLDDIHRRAHQLSAFVCTQQGAMPFVPNRYIMV